MFKKIASWPFWAHTLIALVLSTLLIVSLFSMLGIITHHGESKVVPGVIGSDTHKAQKKLNDLGFDVVILDSTYVDSLPFGTIIKQYPEPNSTVKENRKVLLTVNRYTLPLVDVPALEGKSVGFAIELLKRHHLKLGDTTTKPDFMRGSVLEQFMKGDKIQPGAKVPWGSRIDLVIGSGLGDRDMLVPNFVGMTFGLARDSLDRMGVLLGAVVCDPDVKDSTSAFVWRQNPPHLNEQQQYIFIKSGQLMDLWISAVPKLDTILLNQQISSFNSLKKNETNTNIKPKKSPRPAGKNNPD